MVRLTINRSNLVIFLHFLFSVEKLNVHSVLNVTVLICGTQEQDILCQYPLGDPADMCAVLDERV